MGTSVSGCVGRISRQRIALLGFFVFLHGCAAQTIVIDESGRTKLKQAPNVAVIVHGNPPSSKYGSLGTSGLVIESIKADMFMSAGGLAPPVAQAAAAEGASLLSVKRGKETSEKFGLPHVIIPLKDRFISRIGNVLDLRNLSDNDKPVDFDLDAAGDLKTHAGSAPLAISFAGLAHVVYGPGFRKNYFMIYSAQARLVNTENGELMWQRECRSVQGGPYKRMSLSRILSDRTVLQTWITTAASDCAEQLSSHFLGNST